MPTSNLTTLMGRSMRGRCWQPPTQGEAGRAATTVVDIVHIGGGKHRHQTDHQELTVHHRKWIYGGGSF